MDRLDTYRVDLREVANSTLEREWHLGTDFFVDVQSADIQTGDVHVHLRVQAVGGALKMLFSISGEVQVVCDRCLESMTLPIATERELTAKWGEEYDDDGDIITVPEGTGELNVAWNIYEFISLEVPMRHVHSRGECHGQVDQLLGQYGTEEPEESNEAPIDQRWDALKKILDNNK